MSENEDVFAYFDKLKSKKQDIEDKERAEAERAKQILQQEEARLASINKKHYDILNNVVISRFEEIRDRIKSDASLQMTRRVAEKPQQHGTGLTVSLIQNDVEDYKKRRTALYYIKINPNGNVEVERNGPGPRNEDLTNQIGKTTADDLNTNYVDKIAKLIIDEWFDAVRLGL